MRATCWPTLGSKDSTGRGKILNTNSGCLVCVLMLVAVMITTIIFVALDLPEGNTTFVFAFLTSVGIFLGLLWMVHRYATAGERRAVEYRELAAEMLNEMRAQDNDFRSTHEFIRADASGFIDIDETRLKLRVGGILSGTRWSHSVDADRILGAQVSENGKAIMGAELQSIVGTAALGGILFGGAGAVVGAIAGQSAKRVSEVSLMIAVDDLSTPLLGINFLQGEVERGSPAHQSALAVAQKWMAMVNVLIARRKKT